MINATNQVGHEVQSWSHPRGWCGLWHVYSTRELADAAMDVMVASGDVRELRVCAALAKP